MLGRWEWDDNGLPGVLFTLDLKGDGTFVLMRRETTPKFEVETHGIWERDEDRLILRGKQRLENGKLVAANEWTDTLFLVNRGGEWVVRSIRELAALSNRVFGQIVRLIAADPDAAEQTEEQPRLKAGPVRAGDPLPDGALARIGEPRPQHASLVYSVTFAPDGKTLAVGTAHRTIRLFEPDRGKLVRELILESFPVVYGLAFSSDGRKLASAGFGGPAPYDPQGRWLDRATGRRGGQATVSRQVDAAVSLLGVTEV